MTALASRFDTRRAPTSPRIFRLVVAITALVTMAVMVTSLNDTVSVAIVVIVIALFGIPHGAVDHLVAATFERTTPSASVLAPVAQVSQLRFHLLYVGAMATYGLVWLAIPGVALAGFLLVSIHHFGQSDLAHLGIDRWRQLTIQLSRGLFLVGLVLVANLTTVAPVIERMGGFDPASWRWLAGHTALWSTVLVGQQLAVGLVVAPRVGDRATIKREVITIISLTALFVAADPLIGFAVYFGLWHSLNHLNVLANVLGNRASLAALRPIELARLVAPRSAVSIAALAILVGGAQSLGQTALIVPITLVFVSMLTLPHMVVVERLWSTTAAGS
jgi:Brp/Blh family beta-carotene 15,15'-monooxygenase|tara:strand:- start:645 stop:1640 length:996 start_codon:yes stop_codon:yes gene_type:complete